MTPRPLKSTLTLQIDDRGAVLRTPEGEILGWMPEARPGPGRRSAWANALRELAPAGTEVQLLLGQPPVSVECQDAPYLSAKEQRDVAARIAAAEEASQPLASAAALDLDPAAEGGHVLWAAMVPQADLYDWLGALEGAGLSMAFASPFQRALRCGLERLGELPASCLVLAVEPGVEGHILIFRGRALVLVRNFRLPESDPDASELIFEEISRLLQFFKQKQRGASFEHLHVVGLADLGGPLTNRLQGALRLGVKILAPALWPVLQQGLQVERGRRNALNLVPQEVQDAQRLRLFRGAVWIAASLMIILLLAGTLFIRAQEENFRQAAEAAERRLAEREAKTSDEGRIIQARLPILRLRAAEKRQVQATQSLARLGTLLLKAPPDIQLEKVEVFEVPGDTVAHRFTVTGLAFTENRFSVGPLALYLNTLAKEPGVVLAPVSEVSVSDRTTDQGTEKPEQKAVTRFTLQGTAP